jgi:predicted transcriptional regulator
MKNSKVYQWIIEGGNRKKILLAVSQPMTAKQLSKKTGIPVDTCSYLLAKFSINGLVICLNPDAIKSRLYWLTAFGIRCQKQLHQELGLFYKKYTLPNIDWHLYGWVNFNHRAAIIKILIIPMQPSEIKRTLWIHRSNIKISANNIRDIIKLFLARGIVKPIKIRKKAHPRYELTELGTKLRQLLIRADAVL